MDKETKDLGEVNKEKDLMAKDVLQMRDRFKFCVNPKN